VSTLIVPPLDEEPWPTLGPQVVELIEECCIFGPGSLKGQPAVVDAEKRAAIYRMYEVYPKGHPFAGRRRFKRGGVSWRKGMAKTEFMAWVAFAELHPDGPVRCDGFDSRSNPVGRPVADPYIPLLAFTQEQVEELAYGALYVMVTEGPDADLFDSTLDRIIRLGPSGRADGKCVPLAGSPNARDGARTTFQGLDEPHRMYLPRLMQAHETMTANLSKRALEDPWTLYVGTAGEPGQGSVAEGVHQEAELIAKGEIDDPQLFYFHREADGGHDLSTLDGRIAAVTEATGPVGEYGPGQFLDIARQWERPGSDKKYLERVWLNRWVASEAQAFDVDRWRKELRVTEPIPRGSFVTAGFDGARFRDATALVITDIPSGRQQCIALWERPVDVEDWEVPEDEVTEAVADMFKAFDVWAMYADPPHWTETVGTWAGKWPDQVLEWWTNRRQPMGRALRAFREAQDAGEVTWTARDDRDAARFASHIGAAGREDTNLYAEDGQKLWLLRKIHPDRKFDAAMAATLSWQARLDALRKGAKPRRRKAVPKRIF
jgi:hypothetical protein